MQKCYLLLFHENMKLGDNTLNKEGLSLVNTKLPMKKIANCSPYFTLPYNMSMILRLKGHLKKR